MDITFAIFAFNSRTTIVPAIKAICDAMIGRDFSYEIIVIDDCSVDSTVAEVRQAIDELPDHSIHLVVNDRNSGFGYNYTEGALLGKGKFYKFVHSGNIEGSEGIGKFIDRIGEADIISYWIDDNRPLNRRLISRAYTILINLIGGHSLKYYGGAGVLLREDVLRFHPNNNRVGFSAELLTILLNNHRSFLEIELTQHWSTRGKSTSFSLRNYLSVFQSLINIFLRRFDSK